MMIWGVLAYLFVGFLVSAVFASVTREDDIPTLVILMGIWPATVVIAAVYYASLAVGNAIKGVAYWLPW